MGESSVTALAVAGVLCLKICIGFLCCTQQGPVTKYERGRRWGVPCRPCPRGERIRMMTARGIAGLGAVVALLALSACASPEEPAATSQALPPQTAPQVVAP